MNVDSPLFSEGKCLFCNGKFEKKAIGRHLGTHLAKMYTGKPGRSFHLKVDIDTRYGDAPYFLHLWVDGDEELGEIDFFLRRIWLECCGHMSAFTLPNKKFQFGKGNSMNSMLSMTAGVQYEEDEFGGVDMKTPAKNIFVKGVKLKYEYDFGSTTDLLVTVMNEYPMEAPEGIVLMSRNEPPKIMCEMCGKEPAINICNACMYEEYSAFCGKCGKKHAKTCGDFEDGALPVVNSPRVGVCGYTGGTIDMERDVMKG